MGRCSGLRHTATSSRALKGAGHNPSVLTNPLSAFSRCIGWPRHSLALDSFGLTLGRWFHGRFTEGLLLGGVCVGAVLQEEAQVFLETPDRVYDGIDGAVLCVESGRDFYCEVAYSGEFSQERFGVEVPRIGKLVRRNEVRLHWLSTESMRFS